MTILVDLSQFLNCYSFSNAMSLYLQQFHCIISLTQLNKENASHISIAILWHSPQIANI